MYLKGYVEFGIKRNVFSYSRTTKYQKLDLQRLTCPGMDIIIMVTSNLEFGQILTFFGRRKRLNV